VVGRRCACNGREYKRVGARAKSRRFGRIAAVAVRAIRNTPYELKALTLDFERLAVCARVGFESSASRRGGALAGAAIDAAERVVRNPHEALAAHMHRAVFARSDEDACQLHLLVRNAEQLGAAIELRPASITLDYLDLYGLRPSVEQVKQSRIAARVASPRVLKPGEARILNFLLSLDCAILVAARGLAARVARRRSSAADWRFQLKRSEFGDRGDVSRTGLGPSHADA